MKQFACGEVIPGCRSVFVGSDEAAILDQVAVHARDDHALSQIPDSLVEQVRERIAQV